MRTGIRTHRLGQALCVGLSFLPMVGCSLAVLVTRTVINEPILVFDSIMLKAKMDRLAKSAWKDFVAENPQTPFTHSFKEGFLDGYVSYLDAGGNCMPPATPPRKYWRYMYLTPTGAQRVKEYMEGYQEGSVLAKGSNMRQILQVPVLIGDDELNTNGSSLKPNAPKPPQPSANPTPDSPTSPPAGGLELPKPRPGAISKLPEMMPQPITRMSNPSLTGGVQ